MKNFVVIFLFLIGGLLFNGCQKQKLKKKYEGTYYFTTISCCWTLTSKHQDTIQFTGSISIESKTTIKINFTPNSAIYPTVDQDGILSYDSYLEAVKSRFFSGSFDEAGNITFSIGYALQGGGCSESVKGIRQ